MRAYPKDNHYRDPHLLALAQGRECLLQVPNICNHGPTVACHSNAGKHAKATSIKAHDFMSIWGCAACHRWLDESYSATREQRQAAFADAHERQKLRWLDIADDPDEFPKNRITARKALTAYENWTLKCKI